MSSQSLQSEVRRTNELLLQMIELFQTKAKSDEKLVKASESIAEHSESATAKLTSIELRQCMAQGEGTDAIRHVGAWCSAQGAHVSSTHVEYCLKQVLKGTQASYKGLFNEKDERRSEYLTAQAYMAIELAEKVKDPLYADEESFTEGHLLPSFRLELERLCVTKDGAGLPDEIPEAGTPEEGKTLRLLRKALKPVPPELLEAYKWALPVQRKYEIVEPVEPLSHPWAFGDFGASQDAKELQSSWDKLPAKMASYVKKLVEDFKYIKGDELLKKHPKQVWTECLVFWAEGRKNLADRSHRLEAYQFAKKCKQGDPAAEKAKDQDRFQLRERFEKVHDPEATKINKLFLEHKKDIEEFEKQRFGEAAEDYATDKLGLNF